MTQLNAIPNGHKRAKGAGSANDEPTNVVYYEGERIYFRPIELADEPRLRQWINDPRVWRGLMHRPPMNACRERECRVFLPAPSRDGSQAASTQRGQQGTQQAYRVHGALELTESTSVCYRKGRLRPPFLPTDVSIAQCIVRM